MRKPLLFKCFLALLAAGTIAFQTHAETALNTTNSVVMSDQNADVSVTVKDQAGVAVIGAMVISVENPAKANVTGADGTTTISGVPSTGSLTVSMLGYKDQTVAIGGKSTMVIVLEEEAISVDEVVVVGYGTQKKVNVVGSIATVSSEDLANRATTSVSQSLTGQMPGVTITSDGGRPGASDGTIRVRGVGSFGATPSALVLIDGLPGDMNSLNPDDIESVSVLKDAATSAIYGARAANGVVLVTTKTGKKESVTISYNGYAGFSMATALPEFVNTWEYAEVMNGIYGYEMYDATARAAMQDGSMPDTWANEKYVDDLFSRNGFQTGHDVSFAGGTGKTQYYVSGGFLSQDGLIEKNNYTRYNGRVNITSQIAPKIKMTARVQASRENTDEPNTAGSIDGTGMLVMVQQAMRFPGIRPNVLSSGNWGSGYQGFGSVVSWINSESLYQVDQLDLNSNVKFDYEPIEGLTISAIGGFNYTNYTTNNYRATLTVENNGVESILGPSYLDEMYANTEYKTFQATINYDKSFNDLHNLNILAGYSWEDEKYRYITAYRDDYAGNDLPYLSAGSPDNQQNTGDGYDWAIQSLFGRMQYNYDERYLAEVTMRYDGSSRFPTNQKYGFFPSVAAGWRVTEEEFMKNNSSFDFLDNFKVKASIGILGNNNIGNYPYQSVYELGSNYAFGGVVNLGSQLSTYNDPNLKWETTRTIDGGFEATLWKGLLNFNVSYFDRYTYDILYQASSSVSSIFGLTMSETNAGEVKNSGWEFDISHQNTIGDFSYGVAANFSIIKNEVKSLGIGDVLQPNGYVGDGSSLFLGYPISLYYGYQTDGVFVDQADIDAFYATTDQSSLGSSYANTKPGDIKYKDISGPDGVPDGSIDATYDKVYLGSSIPKFTYGLNLNAAYKGFDLSVMLQGVAGVKGMLSYYAGVALYSEGNIQRWMYEGAFDEENPTQYPDYPRITEIGAGATTVNTQTSDWWVRDASYMRIKNIQLGYTIPERLIKNSGVSRIRVYATAENPFTFSGYPQGWDPETSTSGQYYPFLSTFVFGVNLQF